MLPEWSESRRWSRRRPIARAIACRYSRRVASIAKTYRANRRRIWRVVRRILLVLVLIPTILVPVYRFVPAASTLMIFEWVTSLGAIKRTWMPFEEISRVLVASVIMSEDGKFCTHNGVDWSELGKVLDRSAGPNRGASTIAMQLAKNLFLWPSRSYLRKAIEMPIALYADLLWGKKREMEIYLNVVEWGPGVFGAEAAARHYFKRDAKALTAGQAALLAAALPNPAARDPARPTRQMQAIARTIAARAQASGAYIDCLYP
jgi:monofunctional biosynthetic peptidoglycan transglycosylase